MAISPSWVPLLLLPCWVVLPTTCAALPGLGWNFLGAERTDGALFPTHPSAPDPVEYLPSALCLAPDVTGSMYLASSEYLFSLGGWALPYRQCQLLGLLVSEGPWGDGLGWG